MASLSAIDAAPSTAAALNAVEAGLQASIVQAVETMDNLASELQRDPHQAGRAGWLAKYGKGNHGARQQLPASPQRELQLMDAPSSGSSSAEAGGFSGSRGPSAASAPASSPAPTSVAAAVSAATSAAAAAHASADHFIPLPVVTPLAFDRATVSESHAFDPVSLRDGDAALGLRFAYRVPLLTSQAAACADMETIDQQEGAAIAGGRAVPLPVDLRAVSASAGLPAAGAAADFEWNEQFQQLLERPQWAFGAAASKSVAAAALTARFRSIAIEAAEVLASEQGLPPHLCSLPPLNFGGERGSSGESSAYFYKGILLRVVQGAALASADLATDSAAYTTVLFRGLTAALRKVASHDLNAQGLIANAAAALQREAAAAGGTLAAAAAASAPPPVRVVLTAVIDVSGFRFTAMAIPPVDEDATLVYGKLSAERPFVQRSPELGSALRRIGKLLSLKPHAVDTLAEAPVPLGGISDGSVMQRTIVIPLSVDLQGHSCSDGRAYVMNVGRLLPSDLPSSSAYAADAMACALRPELLAALPGQPLSSDVYRAAAYSNGSAPAGGSTSSGITIGTPPDAQANDIDAARASEHLLSTVIPAFAASLDALDVLPADSYEMTVALHAAGVNARHLGRIAGHSAQPHVVALCEVEMVARVAKHVLAKNMRRLVRQAAATASSSHRGSTGTQAWRASHVAVVQTELLSSAADLFCLFLGSPNDAEATGFWEAVVVPAVAAKFQYRLRHVVHGGSGGVAVATISLPPHKTALLSALQHHCCVSLVRDLPPLPLITPVLATTIGQAAAAATPTMTSALASGADSLVARAVEATTRAITLVAPAPSAMSPGGKAAHGEDLLSRVPGLAPALFVSSGSVKSGSAMFAGAPASVTSAYPVESVLPTAAGAPGPAEPIVTMSDLLPLRAASTCCLPNGLPTPSRSQPETATLAVSGEALMGRGEAEGGLAALNLRVAVLEAAAAHNPAGAPDPALPRALLAVARAQLVSRAYAACAATAAQVLPLVSGRSAVATKALLLRGQAAALLGDVNGGLALYAQAQAAASWLLGRSHPLLLLLAADMASALALAGRPAAAASLLGPAAEVAARSTSLGPKHPALGRAWLLVGHCHRSAAAAAHAWLRGASASALVGEAQAQAAAHLNQAAHAYERALVLTQMLVGAAAAAASANAASVAAAQPPSPPDSTTLRVLLSTLPEAAAAADVPVHVATAPVASCKLLADAAFCLADSLGMIGAGEPAGLAAAHAYELRRHLQQRYHSDDNIEPLLRCLQQLASLADRAGRPVDALRYLEPLLAALKEAGSVGAGVTPAVVQVATRHAVRLTFRAMPAAHRATLQQVIAVGHTTPGSATQPPVPHPHSPAAVAFVVGRLFDHPGGPCAYVRLVAGQVLAAVAAGSSLFTFAAMAAAPGQPSLLDQLAVLAGLLAEPGSGAGVDLSADFGCATTSQVGVRSTVGSALRPAHVAPLVHPRDCCDVLLRLSAGTAADKPTLAFELPAARVPVFE